MQEPNCRIYFYKINVTRIVVRPECSMAHSHFLGGKRTKNGLDNISMTLICHSPWNTQYNVFNYIIIIKYLSTQKVPLAFTLFIRIRNVFFMLIPHFKLPCTTNFTLISHYTKYISCKIIHRYKTS